MSSVNKRLLEYHISRLNDKNPEVRLKAIRELELLGDLEALEPLKDVYNRDSDPIVKKAAQEAGRVIFKSQKSAQDG